MVPERID